MKNLFTTDHILTLLLVFVPVAFVFDYVVRPNGLVVFITSAIAIVPLAGWMGRATEHLSARVGAGLGGLLNATFGNAAELIIAIIALRAGLHDLVKASITGSIIGNILLVFGLAALSGGMRYKTQHFNRTAATTGATLLVLSVIALLVPAVFHSVTSGTTPGREHQMSLVISIGLIVTYALLLLFSLKTHHELYADTGHEDDGHEPWSAGRALAVLLGSAVLVGVMSEALVGSVEPAGQAIGMNEIFIGVILVAIVGNAAEHSTAILVALKNKMDLSINVAVGSSLQIALFVAPVLVVLSYFVGPTPMDLHFTTMEVFAIGASVGIMALICQDGETHWMEGVQLLAVYFMLSVAFYYLPV